MVTSLPISETNDVDTITRAYIGTGLSLSELMERQFSLALPNEHRASVAAWARWQISSNMAALRTRSIDTGLGVEEQLARNEATHGLIRRGDFAGLNQSSLDSIADIQSLKALGHQGITITVPAGMFEHLSLYTDYTLRGDNAVAAFLHHYPYLYAILREAPVHIRRVFGDDVTLFLGVASDPSDPGSVHLSLLIQTRLSVDEALSRLDDLDAAWWGDIPQTVGHKMLVDIEPV